MEESCYIGDLYTPENDSEWVVRMKGSSQAGFSNELWELRVREKLSPTTYSYEFHNPKFKVKLDNIGTAWIGRHYVLSNEQKSRLYTNCTMFDPKIIKYRNGLLKHYLSVVEQVGEQPMEKIEYPSETDNLVLVIKAYDGVKALSAQLKTASLGTKYTIQGPIVIFFSKNFSF